MDRRRLLLIFAGQVAVVLGGRYLRRGLATAEPTGPCSFCRERRSAVAFALGSSIAICDLCTNRSQRLLEEQDWYERARASVLEAWSTSDGTLTERDMREIVESAGLPSSIAPEAVERAVRRIGRATQRRTIGVTRNGNSDCCGFCAAKNDECRFLVMAEDGGAFVCEVCVLSIATAQNPILDS